jgi:predicted RNA-binding Zn ribbon-like protein
MADGVPNPLIPVNSVLVESRSRDIHALDRVGGDLALDLANTLGGARAGPWDDEWLQTYADLVAWAADGALLDEATAARLTRRAAADPQAGAGALTRAIALREQIHRIGAALAGGVRPPAADLDALRVAYRAALEHAALEHATLPRGKTALRWTFSGDDLDRPLWPLAQAAVDLLRSERLGRLKQCANCRRLFLDASRNASRRWCSMEHCGAGAKVRRTRARRRAAREAS